LKMTGGHDDDDDALSAPHPKKHVQTVEGCSKSAFLKNKKHARLHEIVTGRRPPVNPEPCSCRSAALSTAQTACSALRPWASVLNPTVVGSSGEATPLVRVM
jgi:hypothetical protein